MRWNYKNTTCLATFDLPTTLTSTGMASYYPSPSTPFSGAVRISTTDTYQRPPSALMEKSNVYPSNVYAASGASPTAASPLQPYPVQAARILGASYSPRPESPAHVGKLASGVSFPQVPGSHSPVQKTFKTFLQWKAETQATTADYQRNGFPSPVAWVLLFASYSPLATYVPCRYM
jgi:hypothetical protein